MSLIRAGRPDEAAEILLGTNPMPAISGRICPHTCESECNRSACDEPVSVREVERFLGDYALERAGEFYLAPESTLEQQVASHSVAHVAVVGAGPAGLTAAYFLRRSGYQVTVFEQMRRPAECSPTASRPTACRKPSCRPTSRPWPAWASASSWAWTSAAPAIAWS